MPAGRPDLHQTRARQPCALPHRTPAAHRNPSRQPFHRHPAAGPAVCEHCANSPLSSLPPSTSVRVRGVAPHLSKITTRAAHAARSPTIPMPADHGDHYRVIVAAPDSRLPGPPAHRPTVAPHRPVNHIQTANFPTSTAAGQVLRRRRTTPSAAEDPAFAGVEGFSRSFTHHHQRHDRRHGRRQPSHRNPFGPVPPTSPPQPPSQTAPIQCTAPTRH